MNFSGSLNLIYFVLEEWKILAILTIIFLLYFHYTSTFTFFEEKGIKFMKPTILLGNLGPRLTLKRSFHDFQLDIYKYFKGLPYGGFFEGRRPVLYILDPELIKAVMIKDADHFVDRNSFDTAQPRYLSRSLLNLKGHEWKGVRKVLTPTFSSARLRSMLVLINQCSLQMVEFLKKFDGQDVEMKETMGHLTLEVIGACAFGIKCDALNDKDAHFIKVAKNFNKMSKLKRFLVFFCLIFVPKLFRVLRISFLNIETCEELIAVLKANKEQRRKTDVKVNDFLQILIDAAEKEKVEVQDPNSRYLDEDTIDAQSLLFLFAGYETSSTLLSFCSHVLATNPLLQDKLRAHIKEMAGDQPITYELLGDMHYLEAFLMETLRLYPPVSRVDRVCTKTYHLPGTDIQINPSEIVAIPVYGIHMDPDIYPEPHSFIPERFLDKNTRSSHLFLAFGAGPRNCIGLRFGMIAAKAAMVTLLRNYKFSVCDQTMDPIVFDPRGFLLTAHKGLYVRIEALAS